MRKIRIYQPGDYASGQSLMLKSSQAQHVAVVLRMQVGEKLTLFSGDNREFAAVITAVKKKEVAVLILEETFVNRESPKRIHLAQVLSKGERMEMVIQKAVELGVASITPLTSERSVVKLDKTRLEKKQAQWQAIAIGACEQCGRNQIPKIEPCLSLRSYLQDNCLTTKFVLEPKGLKTWRDYQVNTAEIAMLVGPEGGFTEQEMQDILASHFQALLLGPRILRTETAAIVALSVLQAVWGDL